MAVYSVSELNSYLKELLERDILLQDIWIAGEVANLARPGSGHSYFTLRDANSSLRCVMFRNGHGGEHLANGASVIAHGRISIYEVRGDLQLIVDIVQPEGVGELQLRLEQLKLKLEKEGLFEPSRKRPLPAFPRRIGVITSPSGAVWHDIQNVIGRRYPLVELVLAPTAVQGEEAVPGIVEAFEAMAQEPDIDVIIPAIVRALRELPERAPADVILLARGGGSLEDLWPFNEEAVARAIYASRAPVITGIGHETDFTIADLVADRRAPTPSAAAELAVPDVAELASRARLLEQALTSSMMGHISARTEALAQLKSRLARSRPNLDSLRLHIDDLLREAGSHLRHHLEVQRQRMESLRLRLGALSPLQTLRRGYAIVQLHQSSAVVTDAVQASAGAALDITLSRGTLEALVTAGQLAGGQGGFALHARVGGDHRIGDGG